MSSYYFTEEHQIFRQSLRDFLAREVLPYIDEWEEQRELPRNIYRKFGEMGYFGLELPEIYGGSEVDIWFTVILHEEMAKVNSGGFAASIGAHFFLAMTHINGEGNAAQKEQYLIPGIKGELIGCMAVTEPFGGSDVKAIRSTAVREGDQYVINGSKTFITNGVLSDYIVAAIKTDPAANAKGISMILIDRHTPGVRATKLKKLGWHASDTGEIAFDNVRVPVSNLLGEENKGFFYIMQHFVSERLSMAIGAIASSEYALEVTLQYMSERSAFGKTINRFQVLRHRIAQMAAEIEMNKQFVYSLYHRYQQGDYLVKEASMAKLLATQLADKVATECLQMFGGYGYMEDFPLARMFRDARLGQIGGGTSEILCEIIAKAVIDGLGYSAPIPKKKEASS
ncbi:MAG: acyl-CoA dehydrogenase family protein [Bacteroidota bacterium]